MLLSSFAAEAFTERRAEVPSHWAIPRAHNHPKTRDGRPIRIISVRYWAIRDGLPMPRDTNTPISWRRSFIHSKSMRLRTITAEIVTPIKALRIMERTPRAAFSMLDVYWSLRVIW